MTFEADTYSSLGSHPPMSPEAVAYLVGDVSDGTALLAEGYDSALIGYVNGWMADGGRGPVALYDLEACVDILMASGLDEDEAREHLEINVLGSYVGPGTPVFATLARAAR